jgi:2-polyprenyl-6-methoxyphenol hydroxylase-like FAD-dependent oxidoreductase
MTKALIIGAGVGGLAAGIALRRTGLEVEVFERAPELREVGAGLSLWANALGALRYLGLEEAAHAQGVSGATSSIRTWRGDLITGGVAGELQARFGELVIGIHRAELQRLLLEGLGRERVQLGRELVRVAQTHTQVTAFFEDGGEHSGDLLVGADGLHSAVRAQLHGRQGPRYAGYSAWRGVAPCELKPDQTGELWGHGQRFGCLPISGGRTYWFAVRTQPEGQRTTGSEKAALLERFRGWHDPVEALVAATPEGGVLHNDIYDRPPLARWSAGRVTLLGDAAHPMTPNLGQGACQALEDAVILGRCLQSAPSVPAALETYEQRRKGRTARIVQQSATLGRVAGWSHPLLVALRKAAFKHVPTRLQTRQLEPLLSFEV